MWRIYVREMRCQMLGEEFNDCLTTNSTNSVERNPLTDETLNYAHCHAPLKKQATWILILENVVFISNDKNYKGKKEIEEARLTFYFTFRQKKIVEI